MFNDRYGLTQAVIEGRKSMTRRMEFDNELQTMIADSDSYHYDDGYLVFTTQDVDIHHVKTRYKVGEEVAVAQSYGDAGTLPWACTKPYLDRYGDYRYRLACDSKGWRNKMYVQADLMPHRVLITGIRCERLQDISDADCLREGVLFRRIGYYVKGLIADCEKESYIECPDGKCYKLFPTPRKAFAALVDKVSGRGTWQRNPWVVVYEFKLVK